MKRRRSPVSVIGLNPRDTTSMRIAYIISAYQRPEQLVRLINRLQAEDVRFFIHIDARAKPHVLSTVETGLHAFDNVWLLDRHSCRWGDFGHVRASLKGINAALAAQGDLDYVILLTGQDYPIASNEDIAAFLASNKGRSFMSYMPMPGVADSASVAAFLDSLPQPERTEKERACRRLARHASRTDFWHLYVLGMHLRLPMRFMDQLIPIRRRFPNGLQAFWGQSYWCLHTELARYIQDFVNRDPAFAAFFRHVWIPDEIFFHTIAANSPYRHLLCNRSLTYQQWRPGEKRNFIDPEDLPAVLSSGRLFARKLDIDRTPGILDQIDEAIAQHRAGPR